MNEKKGLDGALFPQKIRGADSGAIKNFSIKGEEDFMEGCTNQPPKKPTKPNMSRRVR